MSEKTHQTGPESPELDMLNEILDRATPHIPEPPEDKAGQQASAEAEAVSRETPEAEKTTPTAPEKNKKSSVYVYLAVLFGAAFLMLLLAYFVQQRNNATALDDLRNLNTASRQELLEQIKALEEERDQLQTDLRGQQRQTINAEERNDALEEHLQESGERLMQMTSWHDQANLLDCLERAGSAGDYLLMGAMVQDVDVLFNRQHPNFSNQYLLPAQEAQYLELRERLFQKGGIMVMEGRENELDGSDYVEFPSIGEGIYDQGVIETAVYLCAILRDYAIAPEYAATLISGEFKPNSGNMEILYGGAFKRSTITWFEEIQADLIAREYLIEAEDGSLTLNPVYGNTPGVLEDGVSRETPQE